MFVIKGSSHRAILLLIVVLSFGQSVARADEPEQAPDYRPGQGWEVPGTGINLGGYATLSFENIRHSPAAFSIDDLSVFAHWEGEGKLRLFTELTLESPVVYRPEDDSISRHSYLALERLYGDYLFSDALSFRFGKFLTPIGRWNVIHAGPLEWTTSRPLVTERSFPTNATGVMVFGTVPIFGKLVDYSIYSAVGNDWRPDPKLDPFEDAYGVHVTVPVSVAAELGVSLVSFEQKDSILERRKLVGLDYFWSHDRYELTAEVAYRFSEDGGPFDERGAFVQGVVPLSRRLYAVGRYEFYDRAGPAPPVNLWLTGLAMKPSPALIFKMEYRVGSDQPSVAPDGVMASVSFLF
jgi:hypothetical protein